MTIYLDILLILNLYVDFILIYTSKILIKQKVRFIRMLAAATVGSLSSLLILLPSFGKAVSFILSALIALILSLIAFGIRNLIKTATILYALTCLYSGVTMVIWNLTHQSNVIINNNIVYFNISPIILILSTLVFYIIICIFIRFIVRLTSEQNCKLILTYDNSCVNLNCIIDTGNSLRDCISNLPVAIIDYKSSLTLLKMDMFEINSDNAVRGYRVVPCKSVTGQQLLPAFKPDSATAVINNKKYTVNLMIAVSKSNLSDSYRAIISPIAINNGEEIIVD